MQPKYLNKKNIFTDMGIGIVCMVNNTAIKGLGNNIIISSNASNDSCLFKPVNSTHTVNIHYSYSNFLCI